MVDADPDIGEYFLFSSLSDSLPVSITCIGLLSSWQPSKRKLPVKGPYTE